MLAKFAIILALGAAFLPPAGQALAEMTEAGAAKDSAMADMTLINDQGVGRSIGAVYFIDTPEGLEVTAELTGLPPGQHGFHVHEFASCAPQEKDGKMTAGLAAGGHFDPKKTGRHMGPGKGGHMGDLPALNVNAEGKADRVERVKGLTAKEIKGHALVIHAGGDNYSDQPQPLGGGGARIACGVIK